MDTKKCSECGQDKPITEFYTDRIRKDNTPSYRANCKDCVIKRSNKWRENNRDKRKEIGLRYYYRIRMEALVRYSGNPPKCACCGEDKVEFLAVDHINEDGADHRKKVGKTRAIFQWLSKHNYPPGFQILCHNCNFAKSVHGKCPHEQEREGIYIPIDIDKVLHPNTPYNTSRRRTIIYNGRSQSLTEWALETGISRSALESRLNKGWSTHDALTKPVRKRKK